VSLPDKEEFPPQLDAFMRAAAGPRLQARVRKAFDNGFQDFNVRKHTHERVSWPSKGQVRLGK